MSARETATAEAVPPALLSREAILAHDDLPTEDVEVPEWGGRVRVRGLTGTERDAWDGEAVAARLKGGMPPNWRVRRVAMCLVDERGARLFSDRDVAALGAKNAAVIDRIDDVVVRLSGMAEATPDRPASEDQIVADLGTAGSAASGSG